MAAVTTVQRAAELATAAAAPMVDPRDTPLAAVIPTPLRGELLPPWRATLPQFCTALFLALSPGSCRTYLEALSRWIRWLGDDPLEATPAQVEAFLARPRERSGAGRSGSRPRAASSRLVERAALRRYYRWAVRERLRGDDPSAGIELRSADPYRDVRALSADDARRFLDGIATDTTDGQRLRCLCLWYLLSGRRRAEIVQLRWGDLDLENMTYTYMRKGGHRERRPLLPVLRDATLAYAAACQVSRRDDRPVFPGRVSAEPISPRHVTRLVADAAARAEVAGRRPVHALRHSYARLLREVGAGVEDVQHALDHASLATTTTYLRKLEGSDDPFGPKLAELLLGLSEPAASVDPFTAPPPPGAAPISGATPPPAATR